MSVDAFRERADRFIADLDEETYLHYSGQKSSYDVEGIYERYEDLTSSRRRRGCGRRRRSCGASRARASSAT
jgi:hypothetical protein